MSYLPPDKESRKWPRIFIGAAIAFAVVAVGMVVMTIVQQQSLTQATIDAQQQLVDVKATYEEVVVQGNTDTSQTTTETETSSAYKAGKSLAELQSVAARLYESRENKKDEYAENIASMKELLTDNAQKNGLAPWVGVIPDDPQWTFVTTYDFSGDSCPVVWELKGFDGTLLAYTTATYLADSGRFDNIVVHLTTAGAQAQQGSEG